MKSIRFGLVIGAVSCLTMAMTSVGYAAGPVTGFEAGDQLPTTTAGDASVRGTFQGRAPFAGTSQYLITTLNSGDADGTASVSGTNSVPNTTLQSNLHISGLGGTEGSGFLLPFTVGAGDSLLTFRYDFLTNELAPGNHNDIVYVYILNSSNTLQGSLVTLTTANAEQANLSLLPDQSGPFQFETGYRLGSLSVSGLSAGTYQLGFIVEDRTTNDIPSGVLIDSVAVVGVPEPSVVALGMAGAAMLLRLRSRMKRLG
jgi:hypothetical protein